MAPSTQLSISFLEKLTEDLRPMVTPKAVRQPLFRLPEINLIPKSNLVQDGLSITFAILFSLFMWGSTVS